MKYMLCKRFYKLDNDFPDILWQLLDMPEWEIDVPESELQNVTDAANCEMEYGDLFNEGER